MLLENWKDIPLDKTVEEINREALNEDATLPERKTWDYGQGYTRPFNKFGYQAYKTRETDTSDYISKLKFNESTKKSQRLQEGVGAGYKLTFYDVMMMDIKITDIKKEGDHQVFEFEGNIIPGEYDWEADHPYWGFSSKDHYYGDFRDVQPVWIDGGTLKGAADFYEHWPEGGEWTEEEVIDYLKDEEYTISTIYGGGWVHSELKTPLELSDGDKAINDDNSGSWITSASLDIHTCLEDMNDIISDAMYGPENDEDEDIEESQKPTGRFTERIHKIEHGNGIIGYAEPGEWEYLFFKGKPCGHITEDGEVYLCKDCPKEVYEMFPNYKETNFSFLEETKKSKMNEDKTFVNYIAVYRDGECIGYIQNEYTSHLTQDVEKAKRFSKDEDAYQFISMLRKKGIYDADNEGLYVEGFYLYESRRHPDPNKWKKGDWAIYKGKRYVTSMFLGGDMVKLENHEGSIVVPQSEVYKATKKDINESKKSDKSRLREGTWEIPNTKEKAQAILDLMQKPLSSKEASKAMYNLYGDDKLFDSFFGNSKDVRYQIKQAVKNLVWEVEEYPNSWKRGNTPIIWEPEAIEILKKVASFDDKKVKDPHWIESSVRQRLDEPVCYVIKNSETGEYASLDLNNDIEWTKNLGEAESFDNKDSAYDFLEDEVISTMSLYRGEEEEDWEYDERNLDYRDSLRYDTFTIEPVYRDSLNESTLREGKVRSERKDYPYGISKYTDYEDDQVKRSYYSLPYGFRSDRDDQEDWERDLRYKGYIDYEKDASDWLDKNADAWNDSHNAYLKSVDDYDNKVSSLKIEAYDTEEYKNLTNELKKARKYRDYAEGHGWFKTAEQQNKKATEIGEQIKKYVGNYVKSHIDIQNPGEEVDNYYNDFMNVYNTHRSKLDADIEARKAQFASAAEGKELFSGRDQNNDHHFYYKNGNKYRQIGSRGSVSHPFGYNRGIRDYYESPDATQEFGDYKEEDIRFLKPIADWNTKVHTREEDSTD